MVAFRAVNTPFRAVCLSVWTSRILASCVLLSGVMGWGVLPGRLAGGQESIPAETLERLKSATALIEVVSTKGTTSGSGFVLDLFVPTEDESEDSVCLVTNAHLFGKKLEPPYQIKVFFHSGTTKERVVTAKILRIDFARNLAVLVASGSDLPEPMAFGATIEVTETTPVFVLGFPFGDQLATGRRRPAITVSQGTISSIRKNDSDEIVLLQVDGGINPGNSGGPVVTQDGTLVGVAMAKLSSSNIGFAVPKDRMSAMARFEISSMKLRISNLGNGQQKVVFDVKFADPLQTLERIDVCFSSSGGGQAEMNAREDGTWGQAIRIMSDTSAKLDRSSGSATCALKFIHVNPATPVIIQLRYQERGHEPVFMAPIKVIWGKSRTFQFVREPRTPRKLRLASVEEGSAPTRPRRRSDQVELPDPQTEVFAAPFSDLDLAGEGRYLVLTMPAARKAAVYDVEERKTVLEIPIESEDLVAANRENVLVFSRSDKSRFQVWSLKTLSCRRRGVIDIPGSIVSASTGAFSQHPVLIAYAAAPSQPAARVNLAIWRIGTKRVIPLAIPIRDAYEQRFATNMVVASRLQIESSGDGALFTLSLPRSVDVNGFMVLSLHRPTAPVVRFRPRDAKYAAPTVDGRWICTSGGIDAAQTVPISTPCFPSAHVGAVVVLFGNEIHIVSTINGKVIAKLPDLEELTTTRDEIEHSKLPFYRRVLLIPQHDLLITIPFSDDRLFLRTLQLDLAESTKPTKRQRTIPKRKEGAGRPRHKLRRWKDASGKYDVVARFDSIKGDAVVLIREDGTRIEVPIKRLSESDRKHLERIR